MRVAALALCQGPKHDVPMIPTNTLLRLKFLTPTRSVTKVAQVRIHPVDAILANVKHGRGDTVIEDAPGTYVKSR